MNDRDPYFLLSLSALDAPPPAHPAAARPAVAEEDTDAENDGLLDRLQQVLKRRGYDLS